MMTPQDLRSHLRGIMLTPVVPTRADGSVNVAGIRAMTRFAIEAGVVSGTGVIVPMSTSGEFMSFSDAEFAAVLEVTIDAAADEVPVLAGTNHMDLAGIIERSKLAQSLGAAGVMFGPPFYFTPTREEILDHYRRVSEAIDIGIVVYNNVFATQVDLQPDVLTDLAELPNVVGLKEARSWDPSSDAKIDAVGDRIAIFSGGDVVGEPAARLRGAPGFVSPLSTIAPELSVRVESLLRAGDFAAAARYTHSLRGLYAAYAHHGGGGYVAALKAGLALRGIDAGDPRPPIRPLPAADVAKLADEMARHGVLTQMRPAGERVAS